MNAPETIEDFQPVVVTEECLLGDLIKAASRRFKDLAVPWRQLSEEEQTKLMQAVADDARQAVRQATRILASDNRVHFRASVESVTFKDGVKSVLTMANTQESHALADRAGGTVLVVIEDGDKYMELGDATAGEPDQGALFGKGTTGSEGARLGVSRRNGEIDAAHLHRTDATSNGLP